MLASRMITSPSLNEITLPLYDVADCNFRISNVPPVLKMQALSPYFAEFVRVSPAKTAGSSAGFTVASSPDVLTRIVPPVI